MAKVLLVDADLNNRVPLQTALTAAGYAVSCAPTGSFALTMVERDRPDVIVSQAHVQDMDGLELCSILRADPLTRATPFILVAGSASMNPGPAHARVDKILPGGSAPSTVVHWAGMLLRRKTLNGGGTGEAAGRVAAWRAALKLPATFHGSLAALDVTDVTQLIALGRKTGWLVLSLGAGEGAMVFESGSLVHAWFCRETGERAFKALLLAAQRERSGNFCFFPADGKTVPATPKTIHTRLEQLLLVIAREIDESRVAGGNGRGVIVEPLAGKDA